MKKFLGSYALGKVLADLRLTCLDVGARDEFTRDLLAIAPAVNAFGFEPDAEECGRLNESAKTHPGPWRSLRFLPIALGEGFGKRTLRLYRMRGGSSLLEADLQLLRQYARADNYILDGTAELETMPLDAAAAKYQFTDAVYLKIDIQGAELEVLHSGVRLVNESLLAIRIEVEFLPIYKNQPLFKDVDAFVRDCGFIPMGFLEVRHWRTITRRRLSFGRASSPYSRGRLAHADVVYFRNPDLMTDESPRAVQTVLKAAFLALAYECVDHAAILLNRPMVRKHLEKTYELDVERELAKVSRALGRRYRWQLCRSTVKNVGELAAHGLCSLIGRPLQVVGPWLSR